jgi:hypothetical protein
VTAPAAPVDGGFRLVFAGDAEPVLTIARRAGDTATRVPVPAIRPLRGGPYSALRDPRAGHQLDFDPDKLAVLVAIARGGYRSEGHDLICACSQRWYDATARLICPVCQSVLIARGLQPVPQGNYSRVRGVPILAEGGFGKDSPTTQRPSRGKFEVQTDPAGNPLLVVSLLT